MKINANVAQTKIAPIKLRRESGAIWKTKPRNPVQNGHFGRFWALEEGAMIFEEPDRNLARGTPLLYPLTGCGVELVELAFDHPLSNHKMIG